MRTTGFLALIILVLVSVNSASVSSTGRLAAARSGAAAQSAPSFSSRYTGLTKCGSGMTKAEEREAEEHGSDIPTRCKGQGGYDVFITYSACASSFSLERGEESIPLGMQEVDWKQKTVEWRLANGKPFALIMRVYDYAGTNECAMAGKVVGESLIVRGLKGFEEINETVDARTPNSNIKARDLADKGYARIRP
jgi:hypothetical protein